MWKSSQRTAIGHKFPLFMAECFKPFPNNNPPLHCHNLISDKLIIQPPQLNFFPPTCRSGHDNMPEVGYKSAMLKQLVAICDDQVLCQEAWNTDRAARRGCKG